VSLSRAATFLTVFFFLFPPPGIAAPSADITPVDNPKEDLHSRQEVFLSFTYRNLVDKVIIAYYENGEYYLPVSEIFSTLNIPHQINSGNLSMEGFFLDPENTFRFQFLEKDFRISLQSKGTFRFDGNRMLVRELDYYVEMDILAEVFDLNFSIDINNLLLQLETPHVLPIVEEYQRAERRRKQEKLTVDRSYHPLQYDRDRALLGGAFLDYSLSANITDTENAYNFNLDLGAEVLGGDLQGSTFGNYSDSYSSFTTSNLRWRYVIRDNPYLTQFFAGQTRSDGLINRNFTGIRLTNEPIEPRFLYDSYEIQGRAAQGSEVELYYNNALYDFRRITENEQYRFLAPLTYGTSRLRLRIYGPDGRITEREERIQIPFSFLPKGEFSYHLNAGRLDNAIFGSNQKSNILQGDLAYGISNILTQKFGVEYFNEFPDQSPLIYSSTSTRLFDNYLLNLDLAPGAFYRLSSNTIYPGSASWGIGYTYFTDDGIYNILGYDQEISGNVYLPFDISEIPFNIRFIGNYAVNNPRDNISYNVDLNSRIDRLNLRLSYRDRQAGTFRLDPSVSSELSASATYLISRSSDVPRYLQNTFISGRVDYSPGIQSFEQAEVKLSRSIFQIGRIQAAFSRNFIGEFNFLNVGLTLDFNAFRSTSTVRNVRNQSLMTQNIRGSIGYDDYNKDVLFSNRQQVGRSATSLRLFVDANDSGDYDEGEQVIDDEAVRIGRAGVSTSSNEGVLRFSQLQSYHRINMEINQSAIKNPLLVPSMEQFSIITDPNQYKPINIPFYVSGIIEGKVERETADGKQAMSGIRLYLEGQDNDFRTEMQTFSDGSFYAYEIPPGAYALEIDSTQLQFLNAVSEPEVLNFEVEALADGDFKENLNFTIVSADGAKPQPQPKPKPQPKPQPKPVAKKEISETTDKYYLLQLASYAGIDWARYSDRRAEKLFGGDLFIRYNPAAGLYALRTPLFKSKEEATKHIMEIADSPFNEPALVVTEDSMKTSTDLYPIYRIHFESFASREEAEGRLKELEELLDIQLRMVKAEEAGFTQIQSEEYTSRDKALEVVAQYDSWREQPTAASVVYVNESDITDLSFEFGLEIVGLENEKAQNRLREISESGLVPETAGIEVEGASIVISDIPSWSQALQLKHALDELLEAGTPILILSQNRE